MKEEECEVVMKQMKDLLGAKLIPIRDGFIWVDQPNLSLMLPSSSITELDQLLILPRNPQKKTRNQSKDLVRFLCFQKINSGC